MLILNFPYTLPTISNSHSSGSVLISVCRHVVFPINTNWEDKRVSLLGEKLGKTVSPSRMYQSTSGGLQGGISFLYEAIAISALVTLFYSSNINEINSIHLFLLLFTDHHRWSPGWAISPEIKTVMLTLIESSFGHFMTHVIEAKKDRQRSFASWIKWSLRVNSLFLQLNEADKVIIRYPFSTDSVVCEASCRL